jgi:hypothetical protein
MNYGKFFKLNNKKSDLSRGITCYDYIWLCDNENNKDSSEFPVYVTISKDSIDFRAHYHDEHKHLHNTILSLPLSANIEIKDGLTGALVEGYKTNFPRYDKEGSSYLWELHWKIFWKNRKWKKSDMSYFELDAFVVPKEKTWEKLIKEVNNFDEEKNYIVKRKSETENSKINRFIRKLILDFMFDLEHTKVFQTSPHYEHISVKLKENYFFSALAAKANFYYWREIIKQEGEIKTGRQTSLFSVYIEYYLKAEKQWTKCIRSSKAQTNFNGFKDKWFDDPEEEMDKVYGKGFKEMVNNNKIKKYINDYINTPRNKMQKEEIEICRKKTSKWLVWHYRWEKYQWWPFIKGNSFWGFHLLSPKLVASVLTAWVTMIIGSDLLPAMLDQDDLDTIAGISEKGNYFKIASIGNWLWGFAGVITIAIYLIINYSIRNRSPNIWKNNKYKCWGSKFFWLFIVRPFKIWFLSFFSSLVIGIPLIMMFSKVPFTFPWNCNSSGVPSPFFWSCVFLAMLIGVVLQQVTDEKYTEE